MKASVLCAVLLSAVAAVSAVEWVEPAFVESAATAKLRGVSHTVSPHRGMVTYISPARHVQTQGIVLTPPPAVSVVSAQLPQPVPRVLVQPVVVAGGLADAYDTVLHTHAGVYDGVPTQVEHDLEYAHARMYGSHVHHGTGANGHIRVGLVHVPQPLALEEPEYTGYNPAPIVAPVEVLLPHVREAPHTVTYTVPRVVRTYGTK